MNVYALGASKNIGYFASLRLLRKGATVTFLLRSPNAIKNDQDMREYVESGKAIIVEGDALKEEDVARGWEAAQAADPSSSTIDLVLFSIGGTPSMSLTKGAVLTPSDICTRSMLNVVRTTPVHLRSSIKLLAISSTGATRESHKNLPVLWKPMYSWLLALPHADKFGMERILTRCMGQQWVEKEPINDVLEAGWEKHAGTPEEGSLKHVVIIRPAFLTDGECVADAASSAKSGKPPYRCGTDEDLHKHNGYTVSRRDVAHFIAEEAVPNWDRWEGKRVNVCY